MKNEIKRGRGRPRKERTEEELNKPKLPRGRPRTRPIIAPEDRRPRGRPRTRPEKLDTEKRPRGRPRKYEVLARKKAEAEANQIKEETEIKAPKEITPEFNADSIELAESFENEDLMEFPDFEKEKDFSDDKDKLSNEEDSLDKDKSTQYKKLKNEAKKIVNSKKLEPLYPAKHHKENILEQFDQPAISTPPIQKPNISRPRTPLNLNIKTESKVKNKTKPMPTKVVVVTGATSGVGKEVLIQLAKLGHLVIGVGKKAAACRNVLNTVKEVNPSAKVEFVVSDMCLLSQISVLAEDIANKIYKNKRSCIDTLIHCASSDREEFELTYENREVMWATNYLSAVALTNYLQPLLDRAVDAKIITFTDKKSMKKAKLKWNTLYDKSGKYVDKIYEQTKLANLMWALEYDHRHSDNKTLHSYCVCSEVLPNKKSKCTVFTKIKSKFLKPQYTKLAFDNCVNTVTYIALTKKLPQNIVCYENKKVTYPTNKFALDFENRHALWRMTELDLNKE
ncbi:MAG: SDR family NAD(P)-dependent oxidoreductase [Clostridia bacterium]|nr:SDR family NAD(P)-dependent oxidoreductase [Clostridia bacterium]